MLDNRLTAGADTTTYTYDPDSDVQTTTLPNGVLTTATFNSLDRLTRLTTTKSASTLADYNYTLLGAAGERQRVVELSGRQVDYGYDTAYRLTSETISVATPAGAIGATYDHTGDRLTRSSTVTGIAAATATYDANDRQVGITYDNNGNTSVASGVTYGYDFLNHLTSATGSISLKYDGDGNRVQETASGITTNFLIDDNNPTGVPQVVEELVGGVVQRQYTYGHSLISQNQAAGVSFYGMDAQQNVRFLTNTSGVVTDQYTYDAFGNLITSSGTTPNSYRFASEHLDTNLGLYYLRARYYNASTGRFWNRDSAAINPNNPRELNRYVYTADNPANATDPSGYVSVTEYSLFSKQNEDKIGQIQVLGRTTKAMLDTVALVMRAKYYIASIGYFTALRLSVAVGLVQNLETGEDSFAIALNAEGPVQIGLERLESVGEELTPLGDTVINNIPNYQRYAIQVTNSAGQVVNNLHAEALIKGWAEAEGYDVLGISVSHVAGPCQELCWAVFENGDIPVYWSNWFATGSHLPGQ